MRRRARSAAALAVCGLAACGFQVEASAQAPVDKPPAEGDLSTGFALRQTMLTAGWPNRPDGSPLPAGTVGMTDTRLRAWMSRTWENVRVHSAVEFQTGFGSAGVTGLAILGGAPTGQSQPFEIVDLTWDQATPSSSTARAKVERLDLAWTFGPVDIAFGRQPISLGTSHFVGVLDVLAPFSPGALDGSYKPGVDALRARMGLGDAGEAEVLVAGADPWNKGGTIGRVRTSLGFADVEVLGGRFRERGFGGLGWEGELGPAGIWGELAAYQRRPDAEKYRAGPSQIAISGVLGADFNLPLDTRGGVGLMYQDFGARRPEDLPSVYTDAPFREGWAFLGSAGYVVLTLGRQFHPLVNGSLAGIVNAVDGSSLWQPRLTFSVSDNADLGAYGWLGFGAPPRLEADRLLPVSEFGMAPTGGGLYARWFF